MKSLQVLTLRPDLFQKVTSFLSVSGARASAWNDELATIADSVPETFGFEEALGIICVDLGLTRGQATDVFDFGGSTSCEASATIGQVYKATLRPCRALLDLVGVEEFERWRGKVVAVKVQRPEARDAALLDTFLLEEAARYLGGG